MTTPRGPPRCVTRAGGGEYSPGPGVLRAAASLCSRWPLGLLPEMTASLGAGRSKASFTTYVPGPGKSRLAAAAECSSANLPLRGAPHLPTPLPRPLASVSVNDGRTYSPGPGRVRLARASFFNASALMRSAAWRSARSCAKASCMLRSTSMRCMRAAYCWATSSCRYSRSRAMRVALALRCWSRAHLAASRWAASSASRWRWRERTSSLCCMRCCNSARRRSCSLSAAARFPSLRWRL